MQYLVTCVLLLVPGALAAALHCRLKGQAKSWKSLALYAAYTLIIGAVLCGFKLMRGAAIADLFYWFSPPLSFTFYFAIACVMAVILPLLYILLSERRFAVRLMKKPQTDESKQLFARNGPQGASDTDPPLRGADRGHPDRRSGWYRRHTCCRGTISGKTCRSLPPRSKARARTRSCIPTGDPRGLTTLRIPSCCCWPPMREIRVR